MSYAVQYKSPKVDLLGILCKENKVNDFESFIQNYVEFAQRLFQVQPIPDWDMDNLNKNQQMRLWMFQSCTHFGWFQTSPSTHSIRSKFIDTEWHLNHICYKLYPELKNTQNSEVLPRIEDTNERFASLEPLERVVYTNGNDDPWSSLGIKASQLDKMVSSGDKCSGKAYVMTGGSHCNDLSSFNPLESEFIRKGKESILAELLVMVREC